jgi:vitamin B12 transporter
MLRAICAAVLLSSLCVAVSRAQSGPAPTPSPSAPPEISHVVTSDRSDETLGSAARTTYVVNKIEMLRHGYRSVADAIATLPGVNLVRYGPGGAAATFGIRGSSSAQVLVLIDGTPAAGAQLNSVDLAAIPTSGVERIEVVEGGGSTLYGSGSIGGVVNIITTPLHGTVADLRVGSFGERSLRVQTPNFSFERSVAVDAFALPDGTTRTNADYGLTSGRVAYDKRLGVIDARFAAGITDRRQGVPGGVGFISLTSRQNDVTRDAHLTLATVHGSATTTLELAGTSLDLAYTCNTPVDGNCPNAFNPPPVLPYAQLLKESRVQASLRTAIEHPQSRTIVGIDLARGVARVDDGTDPLEVHAFAQSAGYVQQDWIFARGDSFYVGARAERDGALGGAFSPSIGSVLHLSNDVILRLNAATAFRAPTADDLYYPFFSNAHLVAERTRVGDATLTDTALLGGVSLGWFTIAGNNMIVDDSTFTPQNIGHASIAGFTFSVKTRAYKGVYSKLDVTDLYRAQNEDAGTRLAGRGPVLQANLELGYVGPPQSPIESAAIAVRNESLRPNNDPTVPLFAQSAAYSRVDAFVRLRLGERSLLTLRGLNLGDARYGEFAGYPLPGRSFVVELSSR